MSIQKFLDLSTGHLPPGDLNRMGDIDRTYIPIRLTSHEYGWSIWLPDQEEIDGILDLLEDQCEMTPALRNIFNYAYKYGCWMVNFDQDAERIDELEYFE